MTTDPLLPAEFAGLELLARRTRHAPASVEVLPGDVGRRRYLRLSFEDRPSVIGVVYPPEESDARLRWNSARAALRETQRVPLLIADDQMGNQIIEDFGRQDLAARLFQEPSARGECLERAADAAADLAEVAIPLINSPFDAQTFRRELDLAREAVFELWLGAPLSAGQRRAHDAWAEALAQEVSRHPRALCHRDFHVNNLFLVDDHVGMIDFQDLREGPDAYDLASLLWERSTLEWMAPQESGRLIDRYARRRGLDLSDFARRFDRVLLQRAWKVCGTFARAVAQGRGEAYRRYLPGEIALVGRLLGDSPEDRAFFEVYEARLSPLC